MSDNKTPGMMQQQSGAPAMAVSVLAQYTKDLSFENPHIVQSIAEQRENPELNINVQVQAHQAGENVYEVELLVQAEAKREKEVAFVVDLTYAGLFGTPEGQSPEELKPFLLIECPRILFPFARNIIADITRDGGMPPLMLNPVDFAELYRHQNTTDAPETAN